MIRSKILGNSKIFPDFAHALFAFIQQTNYFKTVFVRDNIQKFHQFLNDDFGFIVAAVRPHKTISMVTDIVAAEKIMSRKEWISV